MRTMKHRAMMLNFQRKQPYVQTGLNQISWDDLILFEKLCQGIWSQSLLPFWSSTSLCQRQNYRVKNRLSIWGKRKKNHPPGNTRVFEGSLTMHENLSCWAVLPTTWEVVIATVSKTKPDRKLLTATQTNQFFPLHLWSNLKVYKKQKNKTKQTTQNNQTQSTVWNQSST